MTNLYTQNSNTNPQSFFDNQIAVVMDVKDAAKYLRISTKTVYKMAKDGRLKGQAFGNRYRFLRSELDRFLKGE